MELYLRKTRLTFGNLSKYDMFHSSVDPDKINFDTSLDIVASSPQIDLLLNLLTLPLAEVINIEHMRYVT